MAMVKDKRVEQDLFRLHLIPSYHASYLHHDGKVCCDAKCSKGCMSLLGY